MNAVEIQEFYKDVKDSYSRFIETHISWVIIRKEDVIKIKKPIKTSFLDFSTLEKRKYFCQQEVLLNSRSAPDVYKGVITISFKNKWNINQRNNKIEEYGVWMRRLNQHYLLSTVLSNNLFSQKQVINLANKIYQFHSRAKIYREIQSDVINSRFADIKSIENQLRKKSLIDLMKRIDDVIYYNEQIYSHLRPLIEQRIHQGKIRDVHGDLHAGNIFMYPDPVIFDCIEYNDNYRIIDILDDLAFLCMDLDKYGYESLSTLLLIHYLNLSKEDLDEDLHLLFIYYKMYRANVRAKVIGLKEKWSTNDQRDMESYVLLMEKYKDQIIYSFPKMIS